MTTVHYAECIIEVWIDTPEPVEELVRVEVESEEVALLATELAKNDWYISLNRAIEIARETIAK